MRVNVFERSQDAVREARIDNVEIVLLNDQSVKVSVQGPMFFELGEATLRSEVREFLDRLARVIGQTSFTVRVVGHTDDYPVDTEAFPSNWELSTARAARVARYLINSAGIDPRRFTVMGRGEFDPAVPNTNDANRALNRRVEIIITREEVEPAAASLEPEAGPKPELEGSEAPILEVPGTEPATGDQSVEGPAAQGLPRDRERAGEMDAADSEAPVLSAEVPVGERLEADAAINEASSEQAPVREIPGQAEPGTPIPIRGLSRTSAPTDDEMSETGTPNADRPNAGTPSTETRP